MDHREAVDWNIAELYLRQELSPEDEAAFEEHLLHCEECREDLNELEAVIESVERYHSNRFQNVAEESSSFRRSLISGKVFLRIAATILVVAGLAGITDLLIRGDRFSKHSPVAAERDAKKTYDTALVPETNEIAASHAVKDIPQLDSPGPNDGNFTPDSFFESIINNNLRANDFSIVRPSNDTLTAVPVFEWNYREKELLVLVVYNNREQEIFKNPVANKTKPLLKPDPGLYYWQLQDEDEVLATGRFIYLPADVQ